MGYTFEYGVPNGFIRMVRGCTVVGLEHLYNIGVNVCENE